MGLIVFYIRIILGFTSEWENPFHLILSKWAFNSFLDPNVWAIKK